MAPVSQTLHVNCYAVWENNAKCKANLKKRGKKQCFSAFPTLEFAYTRIPSFWYLSGTWLSWKWRYPELQNCLQSSVSMARHLLLRHFTVRLYSTNRLSTLRGTTTVAQTTFPGPICQYRSCVYWAKPPNSQRAALPCPNWRASSYPMSLGSLNFCFELVDWCLLSSAGCSWIGTTGQLFTLACVSVSHHHVWWSLLALHTHFCFGSGSLLQLGQWSSLQVLCIPLACCIQVNLRSGFVLPPLSVVNC